MKLNQKFFGQEHFERGTPEREFCGSLFSIKPGMMQSGFSDRDILPDIKVNQLKLVQVKYNGMLSVIKWNDEKNRFVAWSLNGRIYFSLDMNRQHPVTEFFDKNLSKYKNKAFIGETYVTRIINAKAHMTEFNKSMSIIKNPSSNGDVDRIRIALFDYADVSGEYELIREGTPLERFVYLKKNFGFASSSDSGVVHLADHLDFSEKTKGTQEYVQSFWNEYIKERGFEGLVLYLDDGKRYKLKYRDSLDAVVIAYRILERSKKMRPICDDCGAKFDALWMKKMAREGTIEETDWFDRGIRLKQGTGAWDMYAKGLVECPLCKGHISYTDGPILGAKIALMNENDLFIDIADGSQIPPSSEILDLVEPLYEENGYLWVKPQTVIEVSYQDLYLERMRPVLQFDGMRYKQVGEIEAVSLRPYGVKYRPDKGVNRIDLRLEQISYFVERSNRIQKKWEEQEGETTGSLEDWM